MAVRQGLTAGHNRPATRLVKRDRINQKTAAGVPFNHINGGREGNAV